MGQYGRGGVASSSKARKIDRGPRKGTAAAHVSESADEFMTAEETRLRDAAVKTANANLVYPAHMSGTRGKKKKRFRRRKAFKKAHDAKVRSAINQVGRLRKLASGRALVDWKEQGRNTAKAYKRGTPAELIAARDTSNDNVRQDQSLRQYKDWKNGKTRYSAETARKRAEWAKNSGFGDGTVRHSDRTLAIRAAAARGDKKDNWLDAASEGPVQFGGVSSRSALQTRNEIFNAERGRFGAQYGDTEENRLGTRSEFLGYGSEQDQVAGGFDPLQRNVRTVTRHDAQKRRRGINPRRASAARTEITNRTSRTGDHSGIANAERAYVNFAGGTYRR
jgi:hypothetical protein